MSCRFYKIVFKKYILLFLFLELTSFADDDDDDVARQSFEKRHIGSLARLGLLPSFRFSGGRYSRSGRARLLLPSQELYRCLNIRIHL